MNTTTSRSRAVANEFLAAVAPYDAAHTPHASISYLALATADGAFALTRGRMVLSTFQRPIAQTHVATTNIRAGHFLLSQLDATPADVVERLLAGELPTPGGPIRFHTDAGHEVFADRQRFHPEGAASGKRLDVLSLSGGPRSWQTQGLELDWELKAAASPYDSVNALLAELQAGTLQGNSVLFEVVAPNVAEVKLASEIVDTTARLGVLMAQGLSTDLASLGYCVHHEDRVVERGTVSGDAMVWASEEHLLCGVATLQIPRGAFVHCFARYAGVAQHQAWLADPQLLPNPLRCVYEVFDPKLRNLIELLEQSGQRGSNARLLELSATWLLGMLGFRVMNLGGHDRTQDAVDIIAMSPNENVLLVECTSGALKADKLSNLAMRAEAVRTSLRQSGNGHLHVVPMMLTSRSRPEVAGAVDLAEQHGVVVVTAEDIAAGRERSVLRQNGDVMFARAEKALAEGKARRAREAASRG